MPKGRFRIPKFEVEDIEDMYTYYVTILKISEDIFWNADYSFLLSVVENKVAYDGYLQYSKYLQTKELDKKKR
ncbi:MAG: hypothetical protein IJV31_00065 [Clostridia bacterium]|nr:hypothetical protein [Clostridia bacterium]